ncbi:MAG TPA: aminotransferase class V-fold PLP-dependent enzyme [Acidobacteriota bacterium]|nr:aminotransferase class V-fold PLP-dependent enzyme [Acidobacteriota bacterium]
MQDEFPNARNVCYLNTAAEGMLPATSLRTLQRAATLKQTPQLLGDQQYYDLPARCRALLAELIHASPEEIALSASTSFGIGALAYSLPLLKGDEVLLVDRDFPSNNFAWEGLRAQGVDIRKVPFSTDGQQTARLIDSIKPKTSVISVSLVHFYSGFQYDLPKLSEVCRQRQIFLILDAIQAVGNTELDLQQVRVDGLCAAAHKWQLAPQGTGFFYVRRELLPRLNPAFTGWMSNAGANAFSQSESFEFRPPDQARRFEIGTANIISLSAYEQSLKLLSQLKVRYIEEHNRALVTRLAKFFREIDWNVADFPRSSSIFSIVPPAKYDVHNLCQQLFAKQVFVAVRENYLRISPHFYNTEQDIDRFCSEFRKLL